MFKTIDLTKGSIWKVISLFAIPILMSYLLQQVYAISDAAICGWFLNANQVAGVNNTSNITFIVLQFAFGCTAGFSVISANKIGQKDIAGARQSLLVQIILSAIVSIILTIIAVLSIDFLLGFIGVTPEKNQEIYDAAYTYTLIIFLGTAAQVFYNLACSFLRSLGNSFMPLMFLLFSTILNIVLDILFISPMHMGVMGAALATVLAQAVSAILSFVYIFVKMKEYRFHKEDFKFSFIYILKHLQLGLPLAFQFSILSIGLIVMQGTAIKYDILEDGTLANEAQLGYGAACKLFNFIMCPFSALGTAMLSYCGQNKGVGDYKRLKSGIKQSYLIMLVLYVVFVGFGLLIIIKGAYLYVFLSSDKINDLTIKYSNLYLRTVFPFFPILGVLFILRNSLQGIEKPLFPFLAGVGELLARCLVCLFIPELVNGGPLNRQASDLSYIFMSAADILSWTFACTALVTGYIIFLKKTKNYENTSDIRLSQ